MSRDGIAKGVVDAWADFTKDSDIAKEDILDVFNDARDEDGDVWMLSTLVAIGLVFIIVVLHYRSVIFDHD